MSERRLSQNPSAIARREWRKANPGRDAATTTRWRMNNPNYTPDKKKASEATVRSQRKRLSGMTGDEYQRLFAEQNGVCAICSGTTKKGLAADHDHVTGEHRGLLCARCNLGLGCFQDNQVFLHKALMYLRKHQIKVGLKAAA